MHSTFLRREHIHGLLLGVAIGDALGAARNGLCRRSALKMFGRPPLRYSLLSGRGIYREPTQLMLLSGQALLKSRSDGKSFRQIFRKRLSWYLLSLPIGIDRGTLLAAAKCWLMRLKLPSGVNSVTNGAATRALIEALATNGTGHRLSKWVEESTKQTHTHPLAINGCQVLAALADFGATNKPSNFSTSEALDKAISSSSCPDIKDKLVELRPFLGQHRSPSAVARHFGWETGIDGSIVPTTIMATYCWLRYPQDFRRAVESAISLGGESDSLGALVGGLVGAHIGARGLPEELINGLAGYPQNTLWIEKMAERFSHWPHGSDDLHTAPALPSEPVMQLVRNVYAIPLAWLHFILRIPYRDCTPGARSVSRRR